MGLAADVSATREASVAGIPVGKGAGVSVGRRGAEVGGGEEQEERREIQKAESRMRDVRYQGMQAILTEILYLPRPRLRDIQYYEGLAQVMPQDIPGCNGVLPRAAGVLQHARIRLETA